MPPTPSSRDRAIRVVRLALSVDASLLDAVAASLPGEERARADRFVRAEDRARHLLGRALARALIAQRLGMPPARLTLVADAHGKPRLAGPIALPFNLSHSGDWIACAIGDGMDGPDASVGVDVQRHEPGMARPDDYGRVFGAGERATIDAAGAADARIAAFARAWSRKEALVKAAGTGLALALEQIDIVAEPDGRLRWTAPADPGSAAALSGRWTLRDLPIDGMHAGAVAWRGGEATLRVDTLDARALVDAGIPLDPRALRDATAPGGSRARRDSPA